MDCEWEMLNQGKNDSLRRMKVAGGYIYHSFVTDEDMVYGSESMCFVPEVDLTRYEAHLRDAYKKGYQDGIEDAKANDPNPEMIGA